MPTTIAGANGGIPLAELTLGSVDNLDEHASYARTFSPANSPKFREEIRYGSTWLQTLQRRAVAWRVNRLRRTRRTSWFQLCHDLRPFSSVDRASGTIE